MSIHEKKSITKSESLHKSVGIAVFAALAFVATLATSWIKVSFLSFDAKDAVITIAAFIFGPISSIIISVIVALIEFITISETGWYGLIMNISSSVVFSLTASLIYKKKHDINGALIGFASAVTATTGVMLLLNIFVTPFYLVAYMGMPKAIASDTVIGMLASLLLPFNFAKSLMNSAIAMLLYKPVLTALRRARLVKSGHGKMEFNKNSIIILCCGGVAVVVSMVIYFILINQ